MRRKNRKKQNLKGMLLLLMLLATFLIVSSYAWFTSNKLVKVNSINVSVQASEGFQISVDGINWKSVINTADLTTGTINTSYMSHDNHVPAELVPYSTATLTDDTNGYMDMFLGTVTTDDSTGDYVFYATQEVEDQSTTGFIAFDLFFKTSNDIDIFLEEGANVKDIATVATRQGKGMENSARVAFVNQGYISADVSANPTGSAVQALFEDTLTDGSNVIVWEPNYLSHTELAKTDIFNLYGVATDSTIWTSRIAYDGVKADILDTAPVLLTESNSTANSGANAAFFEPIPTGRFVTTAKVRTGSTDLGLMLNKGVTKMRIYMWLEGQDYDCTDSASGSDIAFDLILTAQKNVPTP